MALSEEAKINMSEPFKSVPKYSKAQEKTETILSFINIAN